MISDDQFENAVGEPYAADSTSITEEASINEDEKDTKIGSDEDAAQANTISTAYRETGEAREPEIDPTESSYKPRTFEVLIPGVHRWPKQNHP